MTDKSSLRGYDDSPYLKEMADGIITRRFASVDEAAKAVLDEEAGSNVDRLRRKFREQNWYERGLNDYVEAEINRRAGDAVTDHPEPPFVTATGRPMNKFQIAMTKVVRRLTLEITPTGPMAFFGAGVTATLAIAAMRPTSIIGILFVSFLLTLTGMIMWAHRAASTATRNQAACHLASLVGVFAALIYCLAAYVPDASYTTGSLPGAVALAMASIVVGFYLCEFVLAYGRRTGRAKAPEIIALACAALLLTGPLAWTPLLTDLSDAVNRAERGYAAFTKVNKAYQELKKQNPEMDLTILKNAQEEILHDSMRPPEWKKQQSETRR
ncbi:hypothetical protein O9X98_05835 [Agrobacterium salinitolerans]|nr:hypothetical protein [Agrobacterium salinitolerans]